MSKRARAEFEDEEMHELVHGDRPSDVAASRLLTALFPARVPDGAYAVKDDDHCIYVEPGILRNAETVEKMLDIASSDVQVHFVFAGKSYVRVREQKERRTIPRGDVVAALKWTGTNANVMLETKRAAGYARFALLYTLGSRNFEWKMDVRDQENGDLALFVSRAPHPEIDELDLSCLAHFVSSCDAKFWVQWTESQLILYVRGRRRVHSKPA